MTLKVEYDKLFDRYNEIEHSYKEINLKYTSMEKNYNFIERDRENSHAKVIELTQLLEERSIESNNEKKALREFLSRLEQEKGLAEDGSRKKEQDFSSYRVAKTNRPLAVGDYFIRLKTTSIHAEKYSETLDVLIDLYKNEQAEAKRLGIKLLSDSLSMQLKIPEYYKLVCRAFASNRAKVIQSTFKLVKEIGELEEKTEEFIQSGGSQGLIKLYKSPDDTQFKLDTLQVLKGKTSNLEFVKFYAMLIRELLKRSADMEQLRL